MKIFKLENQLITPEELREFEMEIGLSLPEDYKAHMLEYNGAAAPGIDVFFGEPDDGINFSCFLPIKYPDSSMVVEKKDYLPENHLCVGLTGTGYLAMSLDEQTYGSIYVFYSEVELKFLAASFTEFVDGLTNYSDEPVFRCGTRKAMDELAEELNLRFEEWMQDWPYEVADPADLDKYLDHYQTLSDEDKQFVLMETIIQATNDQDTDELFELSWKKIEPLLEKDFAIHEYTIHYWACFDNDHLEDAFRIAGNMRLLWFENWEGYA